MDEYPGEKRPKLLQHCDVVKLQQKGGGPDGKQWIKQDFGHALELVRTKATRRSEVAMANGSWKTAANTLHHCQIESGAGLIVSSNIPNNE